MKKTLHIITFAAVAIAALTSCAKEELNENAIPAGEPIEVSLNGQIGEFTPADATKATAESVVRVTWGSGDNVFVYDGSNASIGTLTVTPDNNNASYAMLSGTITASSASPSKLTLVYVKGATEAPDIAGGKITVDLSSQDEAEVPFVLYTTVAYDEAALTKTNEYISFSFATSVMTVNCTGLQTGDSGAVADINKAEIDGVSTACELTIDGSGVTAVAGTTPGKITRTAGFTQSDSRGSFRLALAADPTAPAARNILVHQGSKVSGSLFTTATLAAGKSYNTVYQMVEYIAPPAGILPGEFTVADDGNGNVKKVHFSQGNLHATWNGSEYTWSFADNQYDVIGNASGNISVGNPQVGDVVDLFCWSTSATNYGICTLQASQQSAFLGDGIFKDWGVPFCESNNVAQGTWRTLSYEEWVYLLSYDDTDGWGEKDGRNLTREGLYALGVTVADIPNCLVLYPDGYAGTVVENGDATSYDTAEEWIAAQNSGVVCLPMGGARYDNDNTKVDDVDRWGYYSSSTLWSATLDIYNSCLMFGDDYDGGFCYIEPIPLVITEGLSVRLVTEASSGYVPTEKVTGVSLNKSATTLKVGAQDKLVATVLPDNAANKDVIWNSNNVGVAIVDNTGKVTAVSPGTAVVSVVADGFFSASCTVTVEPAEILPGLFSVGEGIVRFSSGNLQAIWDGSAYRWFFAANQYDCIGDASGNRTIDSPSVGDIVDLFGWSTPATNFGISTSSRSGSDANDYSGVFMDWGIAHGNSNGLLEDYEQWRTLSKDEWVYLLESRTNAANLHSIATVCDKLCLVIAPDEYSDFNKSKTTYSAAEWADAEANGIVCLAIACARYGNEVEYESWANYWTSTSQTEYTAEYLYFSISDSSPIINTQRASRVCGYSVRLVRDTY